MKISPLAICATIAISASFSLNAKTNQLAQFMSNIEGSSITHQDYKKYVKKTVLVGFEQTGYQGKDVKGSLSSTSYSIPLALSEVDVVEQYQAALEKSGFTLLSQCSASACGSIASMANALGISAPFGFDETQEFRSFAIKDDLYVTIYATGYDKARNLNVQVVEKRNNNSTVSVDKAYIDSLIDKQGKYQIPNIQFKFDSDELTESSGKSIEKLATYLKSVPNQNFYLVGHTDDSGNAQYNQTLSKKRALAIQTKLSDLGIEKSRLVAIGVGEFSPKESNASENGRLSNRRVELVKRTDLL
ncbi:OmpA family protein [Pseudoalteromonas spongiae]|uniref:OmpA family protein n=1 Tax=Pseudoalteromonas spongiae TaxID=298657 RepID=A0ABU8ER09_9GAMM